MLSYCRSKCVDLSWVWPKLKEAKWAWTEQSKAATPVPAVAVRNWVQPPKQQCGSKWTKSSFWELSIVFLFPAQGQGECCGEHLPPCLWGNHVLLCVGAATIDFVPAATPELCQGGEHLFVCKAPPPFVYSCY